MNESDSEVVNLVEAELKFVALTNRSQESRAASRCFPPQQYSCIYKYTKLD